MEEIRTRARLVDPAASSLASRGTSTLVPRAEIEEVLHRGDYPAPLFLDVARVGDRSGEVTAHRVMVDWDEPTLRELLRTTSDSEIRLSFDADELERALDDTDVEAHGMREKMAVLVCAATAAGAGAGAAAAGPQVGMTADEGNAPAATQAGAADVGRGTDANPLARYAAGVDAAATAQTAPDAVARYVANVGNDAAATAPDAVSRYVANVGNDAAATAPDALSRYVANVGNDTAVNAPQATGTGSGVSLPSPGEGAGIAAGIVLLITGAGFMAVRSRRPPELPA